MITPAIRGLLSVVSPGGARSRLSVMIFHRVLPKPDPLFPDEVDAERFDQICGWAARWFNVLPLDHAVRALSNGALPSRALAITFDDGYADNHDVALPILRRHGLVATFFVATGFLDGGCMWNDVLIEAVRATRLDEVDLRDLAVDGLTTWPLTTVAERRAAIYGLLSVVKYLPATRRSTVVDTIAERLAVPRRDDLMMRSDQARAMRQAGMLVGAHTVNHPILATLDAPAIADEVRTSKRHLEQLLGEPVRLFAYPNGKPGSDYAPTAVEAVREAGFDAAVSTAWGAASASSDVYQLPRFTPWDRSSGAFAARMAQNLIRR